MLKINKTRSLSLPHVIWIESESLLVFFKKIIADRLLIGKPCTNVKCKIHSMFNRKPVALAIIFTWHIKILLIVLDCVACFAKCASCPFLADKDSIVSLILSMKFCRTCDCYMQKLVCFEKCTKKCGKQSTGSIIRKRDTVAQSYFKAINSL